MKSNRRKRKRQTRRVTHPQQKRKKEDGRPKGTLKRYPFHETKLGFMLKYEAPVVYNLILSLVPQHKRREPPVEVIRAVCAASGDPSFGKSKFYRYLDEYERYGVYCRRGKTPTPQRMVYYYNLRQKKLKTYIVQKQALLDEFISMQNNTT